MVIFRAEDAEELLDRIIVAVDDAFFKGNNCVVGDVDVLGADLGAALVMLQRPTPWDF